MQVAFTGMAFGGEAITRHEGKAIFAPYAMPGDVAEVEITEERGRFARARIVRLLRPAPARIVPRCKHFGVCGGCHWQHVPYALQLEYKTQIVREQLSRIGALAAPNVLPAIGALEPWHYRNNIQFHVAPDGRLGFMAARSNRVVPIEECHILTAPLESLWRELDVDLPELVEVSLRAGVRTGERLAALRLDSDEPPEAEIDLPVHCVVQLADGSTVVLSGDDHFHEQLAGQQFQVSADSFFQVNTPQAERLVALVRAGVARDSVSPKSLTVADAYCGVGTFALALAPLVGQVVGIESAPSAIRDARANAQPFPNVEIVEGEVERVLPARGETFDAIVLDPPREGCGQPVLDAIVQRRIPRLIYVSCDPSTLARDVKRLSAAGYRLLHAQPVDMFPQTFHIETIATLAWEPEFEKRAV
jgi:23S rRNA (uracil1939-C5)-methyltransferase